MLVCLALAFGVLAVLHLFLRRAWIYRDPPRIPPDLPDALVSSTDGIVLYVRPFSEGDL